jgi:hypothetical protein
MGSRGIALDLSSTSALDGVGGQCHDTAALTPGKTRYPLYRRLGGTQGRSGWPRKISPPPVFDPRTVHPIASRYTDCTIPAHNNNNNNNNNNVVIPNSKYLHREAPKVYGLDRRACKNMATEHNLCNTIRKGKKRDYVHPRTEQEGPEGE